MKDIKYGFWETTEHKIIYLRLDNPWNHDKASLDELRSIMEACKKVGCPTCPAQLKKLDTVRIRSLYEIEEEKQHNKRNL